MEVQYILQCVRGSRDLQPGAVVSLNAGRRADFRSSMKGITFESALHHLS